jgi:hypothetical protein
MATRIIGLNLIGKTMVVKSQTLDDWFGSNKFFVTWIQCFGPIGID